MPWLGTGSRLSCEMRPHTWMGGPVASGCQVRVMGLWAKHCGGMVPQEDMLDFAKVRSLSPEQFVEKLVSELKVKGVVAGANYRFGYKAAGDAWDQTSRSPCTRALSSGVFWKGERGVHWSGGSISRSFYAASVRNEQYERNGSTCAETSPEGSRSSGARPLQPPHLQSSLVADDFRSLIVSKKREVAILEAALEILETAPRDKRIEDLVRKHNILLEPKLGDRLVKSNIQFEPVSSVEPTSQVVGASKVKNNFVENDVLDLEPGKPSDNQQDRRWNTAQVPSPKMDSTMFGKLSLDDFPSPQDPNFERLQKKRRRQELMKEHERSSKIESLNFGAASKTAVGDSNPREESAVDPLRPNAIAFLEQPDKKPYRSLADRLYEEQFGRPAPPGLKRTYPKGSFYDRCMKEKEQKERDAASASAAPSSRRM